MNTSKIIYDGIEPDEKKEEKYHNIEPLQTITEDESLLMNAVNIAKDHRKHCNSPDCNVSLYQLLRLLQKAGIEVSDKQTRGFFY
jgi:hypothetical protein